MKALKNILTEGILADVDTVINQTDQLFADAEREFAALKNHFLNVKNYDNWKSRTGYHRYTAEFPIPAIVKLLNVNDGINILEITFIKTQSTGPGRTVTYWATKMLVYEKYNDVYNTQYIKPAKTIIGPRPSSIIINDLKHIFKDLNTFIKFVNDNIKK